MKKFIYLFICFLFCSNSLLIADDTEYLLQLFHLAVEYEDAKIVNDVVDIILSSENYSKYLFDALTKYSEQGKIDFALHNAIADKNVIASIVLIQHSKNINARRGGSEYAWINNNGACVRPYKTPLELALTLNVKEIIFYLLIKKADPYLLRQIDYFFEGEEDLNYLEEFGKKVEKKICVKSQRAFFPIGHPILLKRTFIGDIIVKNRLDIFKILQKIYPVDWNKVCCTAMGIDYTPLQFALRIKRYEIAQFLIDQGAKIE